MEGQNHPLYIVDREHLNRLISKDMPEDEDLLDIARLFMRYEGFPGAKDIQLDIAKILKTWGMTQETLNSKTRDIWSKGYRPSNYADENLGSSFDTSDNSST